MSTTTQNNRKINYTHPPHSSKPLTILSIRTVSNKYSCSPSVLLVFSRPNAALLTSSGLTHDQPHFVYWLVCLMAFIFRVFGLFTCALHKSFSADRVLDSALWYVWKEYKGGLLEALFH
jgi:hypothetical protein